MKKLILLGSLAVIAIASTAFTFNRQDGSKKQDGHKPGQGKGHHQMVTTGHIPFFAVFDTDSFACDPAEAKHKGKIHHRFNTLHMKEKGPDNIIVHFKGKKFTGKNGKPDYDYVHFDVLFNEGALGGRVDTHMSLTWKGKRYQLKNNACKFNITSLTWNEDKVHFNFSADFEARVTSGGADTTSHIFKGKIVEELVQSKSTGTTHK